MPVNVILYSYYKEQFTNILGGNNFSWTSLQVKWKQKAKADLISYA